MVATAQAQNRRKSIVGTIFVIAVLLYVVVLSAPFVWLPSYDFGVDLGNDNVLAVNPHSAAADAGIREGDRIETQYLSLRDFTTGLDSARPGQTVRLHVRHRGQERIVTLVARPVHESASDVTLDNLFWAIMRWVGIGMGAALVLLRPGWMTWMFFIMMITGTSVGNGGFSISGFFYASLPPALFFAISIPHDLLSLVAPFAFALFALLFPNDQLTDFGRRLLPFVLAGFALSVALGAIWDVGGFFFHLQSPPLEQTQNALSISGQLIALGALLFCYFQSPVLERKRIAWVVAAFVVFSAPPLAEDIGRLAHMGQKDPTIDLLTPMPLWQVASLLLPVALGYAIIRHRLFDIEFVLSRTLVYSLLILAAIGIFIAIDAVFTSRFRGSRGELAVDIAVALGLGFWVRAIQGRAIDLVDRLLFRRRYDSRVRLKATLDAVDSAESPRAVEEIVTSGAATSLGLASAVFFRRVADGGLLREIGFGWPQDAPWHLLPDDSLVARLDKHAASVDLAAIGWSHTGGSPPQQPVLAVPMHSGGRILGVTFYGSRESGAPPSPDEVQGLITLGQRAASVYLLLDSARSGVGPRELATVRIAR